MDSHKFRPSVHEALSHAEALANFAYEQGFHELGYDPLETLRAALVKPPFDEQAERRQFEEWARDEWPNSHPPASAWRGWLARARSA